VSNGTIQEIFEILPSAVRDRAYEHWCETRDPSFRLRHDRSSDYLHQEYVRLRVEYLASRLSKTERHQYYLTMEIPYLGDTTLEQAVFSHKIGWAQRLAAPANWSKLRAILVAIAHQLYVLQRRYRLMHGDFNLRNIVLEKCNQLPQNMRDMWLPTLDHPHGWRPLQIEDMGNLVPHFIDVSLASCDYEQVVAPTLYLTDQFQTTDERRTQAFGVVDNLFGRAMQFDPTIDLRRLGLLMSWNLIDSVERAIDTRIPPADCLRVVRCQLDHRLATVITALNTVDRAWVEIAAIPKLGTAVWARNPYMLADRYTATFREFVKKYADLQLHLRRILFVLWPLRECSDPTVMDTFAVMRQQQRPSIELVQHLIMDLNPHVDYAHRAAPHLMRSVPEDHPLLPHNVLRWIPE
jgi:hypothetical protein